MRRSRFGENLKSWIYGDAKILFWLIVLTSVFLGFALSASGQGQVRVVGRVVDVKGRPVAGAEASLNLSPGCLKCPDNLVVIDLTDSNGAFELVEAFGVGDRVRLFVVETAPKEFWLPFMPSPTDFRKMPKYEGLLIPTKGTSTVRVGNIRPTLRLKNVSLELSRLLGKNLSLRDDFVQTAKISVVLDGRFVAAQVPIHNRAFAGDFLNLTIPDARVRLEFSFRTAGGNRKITRSFDD